MGEVLARGTRIEEAEASFRRAISTAKGQDARMWELRAATSLAQLQVKRGNLEQAHDLLEPIYGWFTEGLDTPDLRDAKVLLNALTSCTRPA